MEYSELRLRILGTPCHILIDHKGGNGDELLELAKNELERLDVKFSSYEAESITSRINQAAGTGGFAPIDAETRSLFNYVSAVWQQSRHLFDPTVRILQDCYDGRGQLLANDEQLQNITKLVGWSHLEINAGGAHLQHKGMLIDLNSCIRPYAIDSVLKILNKNGATHALIEMDHDITTLGKQLDGANWLAGMRFPKGGGTGITRMKLNGRGFAVRGDFERAVTLDGERFGRAISPVDGHPIPGLLSVAVIADNCLTACSAANVARVLTEQAGLKWLENLGYPWMAIGRELKCHGPLAPG